jgi:hypothetical protein
MRDGFAVLSAGPDGIPATSDDIRSWKDASRYDAAVPREVFWLFVVWCVAIVVKAVKALRAGRPYTFGLWDGGMIRDGKSLTVAGTRVKIATAAGMGAACVLFVTGAVPYPLSFYLVLAPAIVGLTCDFVLAAKD